MLNGNGSSYDAPHGSLTAGASIAASVHGYHEQVLLPLLNVLIDQLPKISKHVEENTTALSERFQQLAKGAEAQGQTVQIIVDAASSITVNEEIVQLSEFTALFSKTLADSINKILHISKLAMSMVYSLDDAMSSLSDIDQFVLDIQKINKQANLLALNATIEAVHAGEAGHGFSIVASEMKGISQQISKLASSLHKKIANVNQCVHKGHSILHDVATTDMTQNIMAKDKLDALMVALVRQNQNFTAILQSSADTSRELSRTISSMVVNIQFQDRTSQYIQNTTDALSTIKKQLQDEETLFTPSHDAHIHSLMKAFCLSEFRQHFLAFLADKRPDLSASVKESDMHNSEAVELF
jgi:methyl-accepting chemotaxis protein